MTESCSGLTGSLADVTWYQVPGSDFVESNGRDVGAYWAPASNSIVLAGNGVLEGGFVRHEMLHALIKARSGHPREQFLEKCGGIVSCISACIEDAGAFPTPDSTTALVSPDVLEVSTSLIPNLPLQSIDDGLFTLVVTAKNTGQIPVFVLLEQPWNRTFTYNLFGPQGSLGQSEILLDPGFRYFKPGESKRHYFDLRIGPSVMGTRAVPPGPYTVIASYDRKQVRLENVQIGSTSSR